MTEDEVRETFRRYDLLDGQVRFLQARGYPLSVVLKVMRTVGAVDVDDT